jgi:Peptidase family M28
MRQQQLVVALFLSLFIPGAVTAIEPSPETVPEAVKSITAKEIGGHLRFLASDLMKGRDTATPELRMAAEYLAAHLYGAGAEPLGDLSSSGRSYFERYPLEIVTAKEEGTELDLVLELNGSKRVVPCKLGTDFVVFPHGVVSGEVEAPIVFAGYGRVEASQKIDDYAGLDVKNRFVLVYDARPDGGTSRPRGGGRRMRFMGSAFSKTEPARKNGALGVLVMQPPGTETPVPSAPFNARNLGFSRPSMTLGHAPASLPAITLTDPIRDVLVNALGLAADSKGQLLGGGGVRARFRFAATTELKDDRNVFGYFPGSDPDKKKEIIVYSAHYDHVGVNEKGEIYNGSDDNASGTSTLLEIAQAFGQGPRPARSVAFLWVSGEEKGLLGSHWFAEHMNLPAGHKIVADINLDMVSRNDPKKIGVTPSPRHADYNSLVPAAQSSCQAEGMEVVFDADEFYFRTDSYSFASKGIPIIFFFSGIHADYHQPTDDIEKADLDKAARIGRAAYRLGWQVAQGPEPPKKIKAEAKETANAAITSK